jgi:hypothetical protein
MKRPQESLRVTQEYPGAFLKTLITKRTDISEIKKAAVVSSSLEKINDSKIAESSFDSLLEYKILKKKPSSKNR